MSSATSIRREGNGQVPGDRPSVARGTASEAGRDDGAFRPWHFFVLASLIAATVAVILSRRSAPEHLIFISLAVGAAGACAAALYRTLAPLAAADASLFGEGLSERARAKIEREKTLVLRSLKELEFDKAMGKLSARDFDEMGGRLRTRAVMLMKQLDDEGAGYRAVIERELSIRLAHRTSSSHAATPDLASPSPEGASETSTVPHLAEATTPRICQACVTTNDSDAAFCKRCGAALA